MKCAEKAGKVRDWRFPREPERCDTSHQFASGSCALTGLVQALQSRFSTFLRRHHQKCFASWRVNPDALATCTCRTAHTPRQPIGIKG